jgi:hypothetical protein
MFSSGIKHPGSATLFAIKREEYCNLEQCFCRNGVLSRNYMYGTSHFIKTSGIVQYGKKCKSYTVKFQLALIKF